MGSRFFSIYSRTGLPQKLANLAPTGQKLDILKRCGLLIWKLLYFSFLYFRGFHFILSKIRGFHGTHGTHANYSPVLWKKHKIVKSRVQNTGKIKMGNIMTLAMQSLKSPIVINLFCHKKVKVSPLALYEKRFIGISGLCTESSTT